MKLLVDTDAFCKLAAVGLLEEAVNLFGAELSDCGRLPALPHMLRRGRLRKKYGDATCDSLILIADPMPVIVQPGDAWLAPLTLLDAIDVGEAQIFASAAEHGFIVLSGDKRALRAVKDVAGIDYALRGRIVVLEAALIGLCDRLGPDDVRRRVRTLTAPDYMLNICFSTANSDPRNCLRSYFESLTAEVDPLVLWDPRAGGET